MRPPLHALAVLVALAGCAPRARMCTASSECQGTSACVAGRCQLEKPNVKPAVDSARRVVVRPVDIGYVKSGDGPSGGGLPPLFSLGKDGGKLFLRFSAAVPQLSNIVEAYVVLHRSTLVDDDPSPISIHATRIVESWDGGSISWARQPRSTEIRLPSTIVEPSGSPLVRVDVRDLVRQWPRHAPNDHGIAIAAENDTNTGTTFALAERAPGAQDVEPYLELYVRSEVTER